MAVVDSRTRSPAGPEIAGAEFTTRPTPLECGAADALAAASRVLHGDNHPLRTSA